MRYTRVFLVNMCYSVVCLCKKIYQKKTIMIPKFRYLIIFLSCISIYQILAQEQPANQSGTLSFLYNNRLGKKVRSCFTAPWFSCVSGYCAGTGLSKHGIKQFIKNYHINTDELEKPVSDYASLNEFFSRKLKPAARPIDDKVDAISSPADGNILVIEHLAEVTPFPVKECTFTLTAFLHDKALAQKYLGGTLVIIRISPGDYHRFHFPFDCTPSVPVRVSGKYESVNPLVYHAGVQPLTENERHRITLTLPDKREIIMSPVGAMCVGKIIETYDTEMSYIKGSEAGYFEFGGSTVVLLFPPHCIEIDREMLENSHKNIETPIKMGQKIGTFVTKVPKTEAAN
jgi:phosphatidylserine decarboxylase